jgi:hypothetical protein
MGDLLPGILMETSISLYPVDAILPNIIKDYAIAIGPGGA